MINMIRTRCIATTISTHDFPRGVSSRSSTSIKTLPDSQHISSSSTLALITKVLPTLNCIDWLKGKGWLGKIMINAVLSLEIVGKNGAIRGKVVKRGSNTSSILDSRIIKDKPLSHKLTLSISELNLRLISCDRSCS